MKKRVAGIAMFGIVVLAAAACLYADDTTKADTTPTAPTHARAGRLTKPWSEVKDLSSDQSDKIKEIHAKYTAQIDDLRAKEKEECMAVLTDDQKKELSEAMAKDGAARKAKLAARATTAPSDK